MISLLAAETQRRTMAAQKRTLQTSSPEAALGVLLGTLRLAPSPMFPDRRLSAREAVAQLLHRALGPLAVRPSDRQKVVFWFASRRHRSIALLYRTSFAALSCVLTWLFRRRGRLVQRRLEFRARNPPSLASFRAQLWSRQT